MHTDMLTRNSRVRARNVLRGAAYNADAGAEAELSLASAHVEPSTTIIRGTGASRHLARTTAASSVSAASARSGGDITPHEGAAQAQATPASPADAASLLGMGISMAASTTLWLQQAAFSLTGA